MGYLFIEKVRLAIEKGVLVEIACDLDPILFTQFVNGLCKHEFFQQCPFGSGRHAGMLYERLVKTSVEGRRLQDQC